MPQTIHMLAHSLKPQVLPRSYGWGLQLRWVARVHDLRCSRQILGRTDVLLGKRLGVRVAIDFPKKVDGVHAVWVNEQLGIVEVRTLSVRAVIPTAEVKTLALTMNLAGERIYQRARQVALEYVERLFDAIAASNTAAPPKLEAPLPVGLCQVFYGRRQRGVSAEIPITVYTLPAPAISNVSLPQLIRRARSKQQLALAWRLFRRARELGDDEESLSEAIVVAATALEVALKRALVSKATSNTQKRRVEAAKLSNLLGNVTSPTMSDWSTLLLGASIKTAVPADFLMLDRLRLERNDIVHDGKPPTTTWQELRQQLNAVRQAMEWLESRL